jgi:hypothetical protein
MVDQFFQMADQFEIDGQTACWKTFRHPTHRRGSVLDGMPAVFTDRMGIAEFRGPRSAPDFLDRAAPPSTALSAEAARRRRRGGRLSRWGIRRARPEAASGKLSRQFLSDNRNSRYSKSRGRVRRRSAGPLVAAETTREGEKTRFRLERPTTP